MSQTEAQEEFQRFIDKNNGDPSEDRHLHPEDRAAKHQDDDAHHRNQDPDDPDDLDEEDHYRSSQIDAAMRIPGNTRHSMQLPPASFDSGHTTGVKGVIADARSYETARKASWKNRVRNARRSMFGGPLSGLLGDDSTATSTATTATATHNYQHGRSTSLQEKNGSEDEDEDEESFLAQWRESRRRQLEDETRSGSVVRTRRTSPSVRMFGRLDTVDALGYLDAIEKVGRETVVVVFVYDGECQVSSAVESALQPLVGAHPAVHFVKVHYDDIEFDNAAVPSILAYRNQGDLFANLTGLIELLPGGDDDDDAAFTSEALRKLLQSKNVL